MRGSGKRRRNRTGRITGMLAVGSSLLIQDLTCFTEVKNYAESMDPTGEDERDPDRIHAFCISASCRLRYTERDDFQTEVLADRAWLRPSE